MSELEKVVERFLADCDDCRDTPTDIAELVEKLPCEDCKIREICTEDCTERAAILTAAEMFRAIQADREAKSELV